MGENVRTVTATYETLTTQNADVTPTIIGQPA